MAGLYIHIPFCHSKCAYCDFYSLGSPVEGLMNRYVDALILEWRARIAELGNERVATIYIGGGTPSILPIPLLAKLIDALATDIDIRQVFEFTIEVNPEDLTPEWLDAVTSLGVNRVSMGVQSFSNDELRAVSRRHNAKRALEALYTLSSAGINYSADLIYGLPGQTLASWKRNVDRLLAFNPPHFSAYLLSYEEGTRLYAQLMRGDVEEASEDLALAMYSYLCEASASAGYRHYEISAFALPGNEAKHNSSYWDYTPYIGLGCSAHSFSPAGIRQFNAPNLMEYLRKIENNSLAVEIDEETETDRINDYIITSLRTDKGLNLEFLRHKWGSDARKHMEDLMSNHLSAGRLNANGSYISIPERYWLTADSILRELIF